MRDTPPLRPGMLLLLKSGNIIRLLARNNTYWRCEYAAGSAARGEVELTHKLLMRTSTIL